MKILSWDVGIAHLAYWFGEMTEKQSLITLEWDLINLIPEHKCDLCSKKATLFKDTNYRCEKHKETGKWKKIPNCKTSDVEDLKESLVKILDTLPQFLDAKVVIIENQPSLKNPKMKAIACCLSDYFLIRGKIDGRIETVRFISPLNKLKIADETLLNNPKVKELKETIKDKYKLTKKLGILYAELMLSDKECWKMLDKHKKKDDCVDSLLQMYNYVNKNYGKCEFK